MGWNTYHQIVTELSSEMWVYDNLLLMFLHTNIMKMELKLNLLMMMLTNF